MLVLSRKNKESIRLPELNISIEILQVKGKSVRVGIDAPLEVTVVRGELANQTTKRISSAGLSAHDFRNKLNSFSVGISLCKKLIENGEVERAESRLQMLLDDFESDETNAPGQVAKPTRALLVEDSDNEREMLAGFLRLHGYVVDTVADGVEAISYLESNSKPDFILMDIRMPRMNGTETIEKIRTNAEFDDVKIFAVSGTPASQAGLDEQEKSVSKWFHKPLQPAKLVRTIDSIFSNSLAK